MIVDKNNVNFAFINSIFLLQTKVVFSASPCNLYYKQPPEGDRERLELHSEACYLVELKWHFFGVCLIKAVHPVSLEVDSINQSQSCHSAD